MKIVFTGGGTGGHFYPIIAVAEEIRRIVAEKRLLEPQLYYFGPEPFDAHALFELDITHKQSRAGKMRRYASIWNYIDMLKTGWGAVTALVHLFFIYPDVVFCKGGYASFPTVLAARLLRIPVVVHESDAVLGKVNKWAATFAHSVAISYPEVAKSIPHARVAHTGNPIRSAVARPAKEGAFEYLNLEKGVPVIFILGGSQGAQIINNAVTEGLPDLLANYQVIHQVGATHLKEIEGLAQIVLEKNPYASRYHIFGLLNALAMQMSAGAADLVVSRAGSGGIFEIAAWGLPSIIIPIPESISHDQSKNAFSYARSGAAVVIQQNNLTPHLLIAEIERIMQNEEEREQMKKKALLFARPDAARLIAEELIDVALEHEQ
jgi:UDP-N-acetylglucosamine--N-acetylmuramyl-(pentapeptide) pyrophosphoryl-undecaprenol N-acetylglucosamine transferase